MFAGTHGTANGLDALLDVAGVLKERKLSNIKIVLVGNGKLKSRLTARKEAEGLDNVIFHHQVSKFKIVGLFFARANLGIQCLKNVPSFYYGTSPNKFFDYIAAGLPVINNYPGWLAQLINEHECGYVVPPDDPQAFAKALEIASLDRTALKIKGKLR